MQRNSEQRFHLKEAIHHLRAAGGIALKQAPADPQATHLPAELAGNQWLVIADAIEAEAAKLNQPITLG